jgi:hypothetical protein
MSAPMKNPRWKPSDPEKIKELYTAGWSFNKLARAFGAGAATIRRFLIHEGITIRTQSEQLALSPRRGWDIWRYEPKEKTV